MNVLIWGTGSCAERVIENLISEKNRTIVVVGFVESAPNKSQWRNLPVYWPNMISCNYDYLIVASTYSNEIFDLICKNNISLEKVCFVHIPYKSQVDIKENFFKIRGLMNEKYMVRVEGYCELKDNYVAQDKLFYNNLNKRETFIANSENDRFIYRDKYGNAGSTTQYFWQDLWAARLIYENAPEKHYDIGSRVDGFIAHLLSFRKDVFLIDIRPLLNNVDGLNFAQADATNLEGIPDKSIESLSALCSLEHFGLGRYGDPIDPEACFKAFDAIQRKIKHGGYAYISVPIGKEHVEFNAHRIFYAQTVVEAFSEMELQRLDCCYEDKIEYDIDIYKYDNVAQKGALHFGLFYFRKK